MLSSSCVLWRVLLLLLPCLHGFVVKWPPRVSQLKYFDVKPDGLPDSLKGSIDFTAGKVLSIDALPATESQRLMSSSVPVYGFSVTTADRTWQFIASNPEV
jgi:hypothetical protein